MTEPADAHSGQPLAEAVYEQSLLDRCEFLRTSDFWSGPVQVQAAAWLSNFSDERDRSHALYLVSALQYFNAKLCAALAFAGIRQHLSVRVPLPRTTHDGASYASSWEREAASTTLTTLPSADATPFAAIVEEVGLRAGLAVSAIGGVPARQRTVVLIDCLGPAEAAELRGLASETTSVVALFRAQLPHPLDLDVVAIHEIPDLYDLTHPASVVWPDNMRTSGPEFIHSLERRLGIALTVDRPAVAITLGHRVPEIVAPVLKHASDSYLPLLRETL